MQIFDRVFYRFRGDSFKKGASDCRRAVFDVEISDGWEADLHGIRFRL